MNIKTSDWPRLNGEWLNPNSQQGKRILTRPRADQMVTTSGRASDDDATLAPGRAEFSDGLCKNKRPQAKRDEFEPSALLQPGSGTNLQLLSSTLGILLLVTTRRIQNLPKNTWQLNLSSKAHGMMWTTWISVDFSQETTGIQIY